MAKVMYEDLKEMFCNELNNVAKKGSLTKETLDNAHKMLSSIKNIDTIKAMEESGYSNDSYGRYGRSYGYGGESYGGSYDGRSYDRGSYDYSSRDGRRGRDADNDGRYSERGGYRSYDNYSGHTNIEHLEDMMRNAKSEEEREKIRRWMREMQS